MLHHLGNNDMRKKVYVFSTGTTIFFFPIFFFQLFEPADVDATDTEGHHPIRRYRERELCKTVG